MEWESRPAQLNAECHHGVGLRVQLGRAPAPVHRHHGQHLHQHQPGLRKTPAQQRRKKIAGEAVVKKRAEEAAAEKRDDEAVAKKRRAKEAAAKKKAEDNAAEN